jgi:hypothetical protein
MLDASNSDECLGKSSCGEQFCTRLICLPIWYDFLWILRACVGIHTCGSGTIGLVVDSKCESQSIVLVLLL